MLASRGRRLHGRDEVGLDRTAVLSALTDLNRHKVAIRRCEIIQSQAQSQDFHSAAHRIDRGIGEASENFYRRSHLEVEEFIRHFADPEDGSVLYVLTLDAAAQPREPEAEAA
jgi:hypothetical protein